MHLIPRSTQRPIAGAAFALLFVAILDAQQPAASPNVSPTAANGINVAEEKAIELSPFEVRASTDAGYQATETLAGSRMNSSLKDVATQLQIMTPEFMQDLAITDLQDALRYSLNSEPTSDLITVENPNNSVLGDTINYGNTTGRTRNLGASNSTHDFFDTIVRIDSYNTERFTFASGPNSILFGNSSPAGTIDTSYKRASTRRRRASVDLRLDDRGSVRTVLDIDQPLFKDQLGMRFAQLRDRQKDWREPAYSNQDRYFGSVVYTPFKKVSLRGWFERNFTRTQAPINTLIQDHASPWIAAGRPTYANGGAAFTAPAATSIFTRENTLQKGYIFLSDSGAAGNASLNTNTVYVKGYDTLTPAPNNFEHSIVNGSVFPLDVSPAGNGNGNRTQSWVRGVILEVNPFKGFYIEAGINQEDLKQAGVALLRGTENDLRVDANEFLDARSTATTPNIANPNLGQYYLQSNEDANASGRKNYLSRDQRRVSAAYDLDFTRNKDWSKWLGRHQFAGLYESLKRVSANQNQDFRIVSDNNFIPATAGTALDNLNATQRQPVFRYYLTPGKDPWFKLPFDVLAPGVHTLPATDSNGTPIKVGLIDSGYGGTAATLGSKQESESTTFVMQNFLLNNRLVLTYGRRKDDVDIYTQDTSVTTQRIGGPNSGFVSIDQLRKAGLPFLKVKSAAPVNTNKGVVAHPFRWLSLAYSEGTTQIVSTAVAKDLSGNVALNGAGKGKEYGFTLRLPNNRLSLRFSRYENFSIGATSGFSLENPVGTISSNGNSFGSNIRRDLAVLERSIMWATDLAGAPFPYSTNSYRWFQDQVRVLQVGQASTAVPEFGQGHNGLAFYSDRVSKGDEITLIGNPTERWRVSLSGAKSESRETNIAPDYFDYIEERLPIWAQHLDAPLHNAPALTVRDLLGVDVNNWNYIRLGAGKPNPRERKYRATFTTRYGFDSGRFKGASIGANYIWRSPAVVGFPQVTISDNPYTVSGVTPAGGTLTVDDQSRSYRGASISTVDVFLGYGRRIFRDKVHWRVQLNVRNALGQDDPLVQRALTTGDPAIYTLAEPRSFILTNSFSF